MSHDFKLGYVLLCIMLCSSFGCSQSTTTKANPAQTPAKSLYSSNEHSIKVLSVLPDTNTPLYVGDTVELKVEVEYQTTNPSVSIATIVQNAEMTPDQPEITVSRKTEYINEAKGTVMVIQSFEVPDTGLIDVLTVMFPEDGVPSDVVEKHEFKVLKR